MRPVHFLGRAIPSATVLVLVLAPSAFGHAALVESAPRAGAQLENGPARMALSFTEPLNKGLSRATLQSVATGATVATRVAERSGSRLVLEPVRRLGTGAYRLRWHTVSTDDGHALEGSFSFGVRVAAAGGSQQVEQSPLARRGWIRMGLRAFLYVAVLLLAGALFVPVLLRSARPAWVAPAELDGAHAVEAAAVRARELRLQSDAAWVSVVAAASAVGAEAIDAAGAVSIAGLRDYLLSGGSGLGRVVLVGALALAAAFVERRPRWSAVCVLVALGGIAVSGHAASASPRLPNVLNDWLHLVAGAVWLGGIAVLVLAWAPSLRSGGPELRQAVARHVLPRFGRLAMPAFLLVVSTGILSLVVQLGHIDALWSTAYGQVLLVKVVLVGLIAGVSSWHALRLRPRLLAEAAHSSAVERRHWRLLRAEPIVGLGVAAAVAVLVAFPLPPRQLSDADEAVAAGPVCDPCPLARPRADELSVAGRAGTHLVAAWIRPRRGGSEATLRVFDIRGRPAAAPVRVAGATSRTCGRGCHRVDAPALTRLRVSITERGRQWRVALPTRWDRTGTRAARALLERAERTMRGLRSVREVEEVTSGPGSYARTDYRLRAPDRMAYTTSGGHRVVIVGERQWFRFDGEDWTRRPYGSGLPFATRRSFRWTTYGRAVRLLGRRRESGRRVAELALADEATPAWFRLVVDEATGRVLREQMAVRAHFMTSRYFAFNSPLEVRAPDER